MAAEPNRRLPLAGLAIAVVGAGRIGSELIRNLGLMGIGRIDVFERETHVADPLRTRFTVYDGDFWDTLTLTGLQGYDFAVCTVDSPIARQRMNQKCVVANANLVLATGLANLKAIGGGLIVTDNPRLSGCRASAIRTRIPSVSGGVDIRNNSTVYNPC